MEWSDYILLLKNKSKQSGTPLSATFELTPFCNFKCNMCYVRLTEKQALKQGTPLTTEQWLILAEDAKKSGTFHLEITGGEAITRQDFPILYEAFIKMGYLINLRTNGYLISGSLLELLSNYKPRKVSITLYGASDETYYTICKSKDGFSVVTKNILALKQAGIDVQVTVTLTTENYRDKEKLQEWADKNGLKITFFGGLFNPMRGVKRSIKHLRLDSNLLENISIYRQNLNREIPDKDKYLHPFSMCTGYGTKYCITWDGRMTLCNCFPTIWSDPLKQSISASYNDLYKQLNQLHRPEKCLTCQYIDFCGNCPARFLSDTGNPEKTCDSICAITYDSYKEWCLEHSQKEERKTII